MPDADPRRGGGADAGGAGGTTARTAAGAVRAATATAGADLAALAASFAGELRRLDVPVTAEQAGRYCAAIALGTPATLEELFWVGRVTMATSVEHLEPYDAAFGHVFGALASPARRRAEPRPHSPASAGKPDVVGTADRRQSEAATAGAPAAASAGRRVGAPVQPGAPVEPAAAGGAEEAADVALASRLERLSGTDFAALSAEETKELRALMGQICLSVPLRRSRRRHRSRRGDEVDLRATLRRSRRNGGDPVKQLRRRPGERPRKLVAICDISGSMAPYSRACIELLHAAAGGSGAEVFSFATRLTRLTKALSVKDPDAALAAAGSVAPDWRSGTRVGDALKQFVDRYGRRGLARGAVVLIVSDGWDRGEPAAVGEQMARLRRLAYRIVWVNPRRAAPEFAPLAGGMAAALPYCDALVSGNTVAALRDAMAALSPLPPSPPRVRGPLRRRLCT